MIWPVTWSSVSVSRLIIKSVPEPSAKKSSSSASIVTICACWSKNSPLPRNKGHIQRIKQQSAVHADIDPPQIDRRETLFARNFRKTTRRDDLPMKPCRLIRPHNHAAFVSGVEQRVGLNEGAQRRRYRAFALIITTNENLRRFDLRPRFSPQHICRSLQPFHRPQPRPTLH